MSLRSLIFCLSLLLLLITGCTPKQNESQGSLNKIPEEIKVLDNLTIYSPDSPPLMDINLEQETRFGNTEEVIIGLVRHVAVDDLGRVYLGDSGWGHRGVYVFESDGSFIKRMAGEGKGPGEVLRINNMGIAGNELYLFDGQQKRINFYSLESLSLDRTQILDTDNWSHVDSLRGSYPTGYHLRNDGTRLVSFVDPLDFEHPEKTPNSYYYLAKNNGKIYSDEILRLPHRKNLHSDVGGRVTVFNLQHTRNSILAHTPNGNMITAWTEDFLLKKYGPNGEYKGAIYYLFQRQQINKQKVLNRFDEAWENNPEGIRQYKKRIRNTELPDRWPALKSMLIDDEGRIWVATIGSDRQNFDWFVLKESGVLLARFKFPREDDVIAIKNGYLYARVAEEGTDPVVQFNINMTPHDVSDEKAGVQTTAN